MIKLPRFGMGRLEDLCRLVVGGFGFVVDWL
jgi:hypothetical protein